MRKIIAKPSDPLHDIAYDELVRSKVASGIASAERGGTVSAAEARQHLRASLSAELRKANPLPKQ